MKKTLFIVNGFPRAGKDTFMDEMVAHFSVMQLKCKKHSTIDTVKRVAKELGWDGEKSPDMRAMLSELKDLYTKYFNGPLNEIKYCLKETDIDQLYTAMREPDEIARTVAWAKANDIRVHTILVRSAKREETVHTSHSDSNVLEYPYDLIMHNDSSIEEFRISISSLVDYLIK